MVYIASLFFLADGVSRSFYDGNLILSFCGFLSSFVAMYIPSFLSKFCYEDCSKNLGFKEPLLLLIMDLDHEDEALRFCIEGIPTMLPSRLGATGGCLNLSRGEGSLIWYLSLRPWLIMGCCLWNLGPGVYIPIIG